jgi:rRNA maturation endonuclease Nob1
MKEGTFKGKMPFILKFAEKQKDAPSRLQMFYDEQEKVTMVRTKNGVVPLVRFQNPITELLTKTEAARETDDYNLSPIELEFLSIKTAEEKESDETDICDLDLELKTKTFVEKESDDYNMDNILSEMYTKTKVLREGEDINNEVELS